MNCHEFEKLINDLACDNLMTVNQRAQAWAHKENCARCAARLAEERLLTERLRLVASTDVDEAPARVKTAVFAAFAEQARSGGRLSSNPANPSTAAIAALQTHDRINQPSFNRSRWIWAAAAAVLLIAAITTIRLLNGQTFGETPTAPPVLATASSAPSGAPPNQTLQSPVAPQEFKTPEGQIPTVPSLPKEPPKVRSGRDGVKNPPNLAVASPSKPRSSAPNTDPATLLASRNEVVTDYIPLTYLSTATALDSGLVVRVQVPRSTLISMGLPMNVESSRELIKADVVVGDDGVARAIRFVHDVSDSKQMR